MPTLGAEDEVPEPVLVLIVGERRQGSARGRRNPRQTHTSRLCAKWSFCDTGLIQIAPDSPSTKPVLGGWCTPNALVHRRAPIEETCYCPSPMCMYEPRADNEGNEGLPRPESSEANHEECDEMGESSWATGNRRRSDRRVVFGRWRTLEDRRLLSGPAPPQLYRSVSDVVRCRPEQGRPSPLEALRGCPSL